MGLLKGNKIRFTDDQSVEVAGDDIVMIGGEITQERVVPRADEPPAGSDEMGGLGGSDDWESDFQMPGEEGVEEEALVAAGALHDYEEIRDHLIASAEEAAEMDAGAFNEQVQEGVQELMETRLMAAAESLIEGNPEGDFDRVAPYIQRQVAAELDLELVGTVNEIRWTHLQRIEGKIVSETGEVAEQLEEAHPAETFAELLAQREEILSEARLQAQRLVLEAQTRASEFLAEAEKMQAQTLLELETERERILEELKGQAFDAGFEEGKAAGDQQAASYVAEALDMLNKIAMAFPSAVKNNEGKLISLALEIASKVIQEEISLQPEIVQRTVETALKRVSDLEQVTIKVNPLDLDLILPKQDTFKAIIPDVQTFSIEGSHTIQRGGCLIETNSGSINATINAQISIIDELFKRVRSEYEDEELGELS
jgi:flagellar assembly protein FliH